MRHCLCGCCLIWVQVLLEALQRACCNLGAGARPPWRRCQPRGLVLVQVLCGGTASWGAGASDWLLCFAPVPPIISRRDSTSASVLLAVVLLSTHPQDWFCTLLGHSVSFCSIADIGEMYCGCNHIHQSSTNFVGVTQLFNLGGARGAHGRSSLMGGP